MLASRGHNQKRSHCAADNRNIMTTFGKTGGNWGDSRPDRIDGLNCFRQVGPRCFSMTKLITIQGSKCPEIAS